MTAEATFDSSGVDLRAARAGRLSVDRVRLLSELQRSDARVVTVIAGAGYGKTTLVRQWDAGDEREFAWMELHPADDDPVVFMRLLIDCLGSVMDLSDAADAAREPRPRFADKVLPAMAQSMATLAHPVVLVIDEIELIGSEVTEVLCEALLRFSGDMQTILVGRSMPAGLRTARRQIDGTLQELAAEDLAFTVGEATALFDQVVVEPDPDWVADLVSLTMGWPVGLHLAAIAAREGATSTGARDALAGDRHMLLRYLDEELLAGLDPGDRSFLLDSSVLEWLDADLCDRVLELDGSEERLERLVADGRVLFVRGGTRRALRFHPLLREYLLEKLRTHEPEREMAIRTRTVAAYEAIGEYRTAIDSAVASGDSAMAEEVIVRHLPRIIFGGEYTLLARWLERLSGEDPRQHSGLLALVRAWLAFLTNRRGEMESWLDLADSLGHPGPLPDGCASMEVATAVVRMLAGVGGIPASLHNARLLHAAGPQGSPWWGVASGIEALVAHFLGLTDDPREALRKAELESRGLHASHATTCAHLGNAEIRHGNLNLGLGLVRDAVTETVEASLVDYPLMAMVYCVQAYADAVRGDHAQSAQASAHARSLMVEVVDVIDRSYIHSHLLLGDAAVERGDTAQARHDLREARSRLPAEPEAVVLHEWADELAERIRHATGRAALPDLTAAEQRVLEQLPTYRTLAEIGEHLYVSRNTVKSHTMSIYRKLAVAGRSDAVRVAKELELI